MRRRILVTLLASTSIVLVAFLVPLMVMVGQFAVDRAQRELVLEIQPIVSRIPVVAPDELADLLSAISTRTEHPATVYMADDTIDRSSAADQPRRRTRTRARGLLRRCGRRA